MAVGARLGVTGPEPEALWEGVGVGSADCAAAAPWAAGPEALALCVALCVALTSALREGEAVAAPLGVLSVSR